MDAGGAGGTLGSGLPPGGHYVPTEHKQFVASAALQGLRRTGQSSRHDAFFMSETMRAELHAKRAACMDMGNPKCAPSLPPRPPPVRSNTRRCARMMHAIPPVQACSRGAPLSPRFACGSDPYVAAVQGVQVGQYHSLVPLDDQSQGKQKRATLGVPSSLFKVIADNDGEAYALRRLEGPPMPEPAIAQYGRMWSSLAHPNIARLVEVFSSNDEGQPCTYIVQQFYPNALTLEQAYLMQRQPVSEDVLWSHALQIIAAVHAVHNAGLVVRVLDLAHVLLTGKDVVRLSCCGLLDMTCPDTARPLQQQQHEDLVALGRLLVCLACVSPTAAAQQSLQKSMGYIQASFSQEFSQLLMLLLSGGHPTIHDVVALTSGRMMTRCAHNQWLVDAMLNELSKECENGRLLRLLVKLNLVADRPTLGDDPSWGQNQDRHLMRLYRDSVFHVSDENGSAVVDFAPVVNSLNKLDVGHDGKTILTSTSPESRGDMLLVSYKDVRLHTPVPLWPHWRTQCWPCLRAALGWHALYAIACSSSAPAVVGARFATCSSAPLASSSLRRMARKANVGSSSSRSSIAWARRASTIA